MVRWVRIPGPGEFRGTGEWKKLEDLHPSYAEEWQWMDDTGYLPTHEGDEPPEDEKTA